MWVFTNRGLLSIVQDKADPGRLLVRARQEGLLESLVPRPEAVFHDPAADYPYRVFLTRGEVKGVLDAEVERIDYGNFKDSIQDEEYHAVCKRVWTAAEPLNGSPARPR